MNILLVLVLLSSGALIFGNEAAIRPAISSKHTIHGNLHEEKFDFVSFHHAQNEQTVWVRYQLRCYQGSVPVVSAIIQNDTDTDRAVTRSSLPWSNSTDIKIRVFDFENLRRVAETSGWIVAKQSVLSLRGHTAVGCSVPFSTLFHDVNWHVAAKQGFFLENVRNFDGKQFRSSFMIDKCSNLPATSMLESKCPD
jgi:hypothetical protein